LIRRVLDAEIAEMGRLLAAQFELGEPDGATPTATLLAAAIREAIDQSRDRLLLALACLYDAPSVGRVRRGLAARSPEQRAYAVEALDTMLAQEHKPLLALLSDELSPAQRLRRVGQPTTRLGRAGRLGQIIAGADGHYTPWLRCVILAEMERTAAKNDGVAKGATAMLSAIEKVLILKTVGIFAEIPDSVLAEVAALLEEHELAAGATLFEKGDPGTSMYIIAEGRVRVHDGGRLLNELGARDVFGEMAALDATPRLASVTAVDDTQLLRLEQDALYELMADHVAVARGIIKVLSGHLRARVKDVAGLRARVQELETG
jgi:hypothetical protein